MNSPLFRRLLWAALILTIATLLAIDRVVTGYAQAHGLPLSAGFRGEVLGIALGAALIAMVTALLVSNSLSRRVSRLKGVADSLLSYGSERPANYDPGDDLGALERSLTAVAKELRSLVDNLRLESVRREAILSGMAEGVLAVDRDLRVTFCNQALIRALGFRGEPFEGMALVELVRNPELIAMVRSVLANGEPGKIRIRLSAAMPRTFEVVASRFAAVAGGGVIAIFHDTTDLERLEQVRKDFVANVSHELRTPLAGIIGYSDTLLDGALDDAANRKRFVEIIRSNAVRLGSIASDLLVLSELESGAEGADADNISVGAVLDSILMTVEGEARERDVHLIREEIEDVYVSGSRLRLEQALLNLVANAIKFNRPGGEVRVRVTANADGQAEIVVADTGVGIPSEDLPRIFERFYRVDKARSRQVGGTGLGLSIVKHVVERMKGSVRVQSQLGRGSSFTLLLPLSEKTAAVRS